jgi:hypothetical protein
MFITKKKFNKVVLELSNRITVLYETARRTKDELIRHQLKSIAFDNYCERCGPCFESESVRNVTTYTKLENIDIIHNPGPAMTVAHMKDGSIRKESINIKLCGECSMGYDFLFIEDNGHISCRMTKDDFLNMLKYKIKLINNMPVKITLLELIKCKEKSQ